jgi:cysteine synthase A
MSSSEGKGLSIAEDFVSSMIADPISKIVIFGLQWCEFSWSLRKFLNAHVLIHKSLELDSAAFIESCDPDDARTVLKRPTGTPTIPQLFVAGRHVGGCTDVFNAWHDGRLQSVLGDGEVNFSESGPNPESHLPNWKEKSQKILSIATSAAVK